MRIWAGTAVAALTLSTAVPVAAADAVAKKAYGLCKLTEADRLANRQLPWGEFDLSPERAKTSMWFSAHRCYASAVAAGADYLANGPLLPVRAQAIVTFHMARNLARTGDHAGAARLAAASRRSDQAPDAPLDWNTYVTGFYAYLIGNRRLLDSSHARLIALGGEANIINAQVLERGQRCFGQPFVAIETRKGCAPK